MIFFSYIASLFRPASPRAPLFSAYIDISTRKASFSDTFMMIDISESRILSSFTLRLYVIMTLGIDISPDFFLPSIGTPWPSRLSPPLAAALSLRLSFAFLVDVWDFGATLLACSAQYADSYIALLRCFTIIDIYCFHFGFLYRYVYLLLIYFTRFIYRFCYMLLDF